MINNFDFEQAISIEEALSLLSRSDHVTPLAGGTNVLVYMKRAPLETDSIVDLSRLDGLKDVTVDDNRASIGAGVTIAQLMEWNPGGALQEVMRPMCAGFAGPLIRNLATIGGNICDASPAADASPVLLALDASVKLESVKNGARSMQLSEFFLGVRKTARHEDELLTHIEFELPNINTRAYYYKLGKRKADAISIVSIAMLIELEDAIVKSAKIALGAVAPIAMRAVKAENILIGNELNAAVINETAKVAMDETQPIDDFRGTGDYRRKMVNVLVTKGLSEIAQAESS